MERREEGDYYLVSMQSLSFSPLSSHTCIYINNPRDAMLRVPAQNTVNPDNIIYRYVKPLQLLWANFPNRWNKTNTVSSS